MFVVFADDSEVANPRRRDMQDKPLVAVGGFAVDSEKLLALERDLDKLCAKMGFPPHAEFKWSPGRGLWMRESLKAEARDAFFNDALAIAGTCSIKAMVVVIDTTANRMNKIAESPQSDAVEVFLERTSSLLRETQSTGIVIVDEPGGDKKAERKFLRECLEARVRGTVFEKHDNFALTVLTAKSEFVRCLQLADVIVGCAINHVAGSIYTPSVFAKVKDCLRTSTYGVRGGAGLKIHPDAKYANLYYWLLGDTQHFKKGGSINLPHAAWMYSRDDGLQA